MKISFHGAAQDVTGSCHLVECAGTRVLIDCGLYQGGRKLEEENRADFGFDPKEIDFLLLTHAHLDHCGRIPLLVNRGFRGQIITTAASHELAKLVMLDSASLQEEEARYLANRARRRGRDASDIKPLYTTLDALDALDFFSGSASYGEALRIAPGIEATFFDVGHILGSAGIALKLTENGKTRHLAFSGDLGLSHRPILRDPDVPPESDIVIIETTYGDRCHKQLQPSIEEFYEAINKTIRRGGNVVIPTFALERSQELLYYLHEGLKQGLLPNNLQIFLDSPMAISATKIFKRHPECYDEETAKLFDEHKDPFEFEGVHFTRDTAESMEINNINGGAVILAGAGMCTGGRICHHLKYNIGSKKNSIVFVGYAANGTLGRSIVDREPVVRIFGNEYEVRARIYTIGGFSAHAGQDELLDWHARTGHTDATFLVHGEKKSMETFGKLLSNTEVYLPALHQSFEL
ncbi:MAG: MBL fold metallo-hydrolase [bacterium]|nr:MBL fold metallo-hydrolase [bacterium]